MTGHTYTISTLLDKLKSPDKDFRYMAANDLINELQKETINLDDDTERRVVQAVLNTLDDKNGEVQNLVVKCLPPLVRRVKEQTTETIVDRLCMNTTSSEKDQAQLRDISSMALKALLVELPNIKQDLTGKLSSRVISKLHPYISKEKVQEVSIHLEILEIVGTLMQRSGQHVSGQHAAIMEALFPLLKNPRMAVRKRAITALSNLINVCTDDILATIVKRLQEEVAKLSGSPSRDFADEKTLVQFVEAICRAAGPRFSRHLSQFLPFVLQCTEYEDDELREYTFHAMEAAVEKCSDTIIGDLQNIAMLSLKYLAYDPNYNQDDADEDMVDEDDEDVGSDDEDLSWKVRRSAAKCLEAIAVSQRKVIMDSLDAIGPPLITRFRDREETVRCDVITAYTALLQQIDLALTAEKRNAEQGEESQLGARVIPSLSNQLPSLMKAAKKLTQDKSLKCRQAFVQLLGKLVTVHPKCLDENLATLLDGIKSNLTEKTVPSNIKLEVLSFLKAALATHRPELFINHAKDLLDAVMQAVKDPFYKVVAEALAVLQEIVAVLRLEGQPPRADIVALLPTVYQTVFARFKDPTLDQEIKERVVSCMGQILFTFGDHLRTELAQQCLGIFIERLKNEPTRLATIRALTKIANSPVRNDVSPAMDELLTLSSQFLRKNNRNLRVATLELLGVLFRTYGSSLKPELVAKVLAEMSPLIAEADLSMAQLALQVISATSQFHPASIISEKENILTRVFEIGRSPVVQGNTLNTVLEALRSIAVNAGQKDPDLSAPNLIQRFLKPFGSVPVGDAKTAELVFSATHRQAYQGSAKCVACLALAGGVHQQVIESCIQDLTSEKTSDTVKLVSLAVIGEIGYYSDLSGVSSLLPALNFVFENGKDDAKNLAAMTLGKLCGGNLGVFLPKILLQLGSELAKQYVFLVALKEFIYLIPSERIPAAAVAPYINDVWGALRSRAGTLEEGYRSLLGECMGRLTALDPERFIRLLMPVEHAADVPSKCTMIITVKYAVSEEKTSSPEMKAVVMEYLKFLNDPDLTVRRTALTLFNSVAHHRPSYIRDQLAGLLPLVYKETEVNKALIREVEMGPFKHEVDDGLDCRKAAYECLYTLLDSCIDILNAVEFLDHVIKGLGDQYDIKTLCFLFVRRMTQVAPNAVLQRVEPVCAEISKVVQTKAKATAVAQETEKLNELKRSAMRALWALSETTAAANMKPVTDLKNLITKTNDLQSLWEGIKESAPVAAADGHGDAMDTS